MHASPSRGTPFAATVVVLVVVMTGGAGWWWLNHRHTVDTLLVGDSITALVGPTNDAQPVDPAGTQIIATPGKRAMEMYPAVEAAGAHPRLAVVNLGTNDLMQSRDPAEAVRDVGTVTDLIDDDACVFLVTVNERMVSATVPDLDARAHAFNDGLTRLAAQRGYHMIDWAKLVLDHDHPGDPGFPMTVDTVHPSPTGMAMLVDSYRSALAATPCAA